MSRLTFVVPTYQPKIDVFTKAVKALCAQSYKDWDAIFVLDGPSDVARKIIASEFKKKSNHYKIIEQEHSGAQRARNEGLRHAKGEFVVCFDSDCVIEVEAASLWVTAFDKNPDVGFVYGAYKFLNDQGAIDTAPFDPWLLRVRNYISGCFPVRRALNPVWNESLKSLQDWDMWLSLVDQGVKGKMLPGYHFSTAAPDPGSISGQGCTDAVWLERVDAVKNLHNLPERDVCVSSLTKKHEGIWLAKLIDADYQDIPNFKPHRYKTIIQLGFSFLPDSVEAHCNNFSQKEAKKILFWTCDDVTEIYTRLNLIAVHKYSVLINALTNIKQFVQDKTAYDMMTKAGFKVEILPLPMAVGEAKPLPEKPRFVVDCDPNYGFMLNVLSKSLPDVELVNNSGAEKLEDFSGLVHLHPDRTVSIGMIRAVLAGRHVVSNVQAPFMGYVDDKQDLDLLIPQTVEKIRGLAFSPQNENSREYYSKQAGKENLLNVL